MRSSIVLLVLVGCGKQDEAPKQTQKEPASPARPKLTVKTWRMELPPGWTSKYDASDDMWLFTTPYTEGERSNARFERAPREAVAGPDAYLHYKLGHWDKGTTAEFEKREAIRDGFAMTVVVKPAVDPNHPHRETFVVREIGNVWFQCRSEWIVDDAMRDQLLALCKSIKP